ALRPDAEQQCRHGIVVGRLDDGHGVVAPLQPVQRVHAHAAAVGFRLPALRQLHGVPDRALPLVSVAVQRYVDSHTKSSPLYFPRRPRGHARPAQPRLSWPRSPRPSRYASDTPARKYRIIIDGSSPVAPGEPPVVLAKPGYLVRACGSPPVWLDTYSASL